MVGNRKTHVTVRDGTGFARRPGGSKAVVCHVTTVHTVFDTRIFLKECQSLVKAGYEVHLVACHDRDEVVKGVHIHALPKAPSRLRQTLIWPLLAYRKVLSIRPRPVICHFHDPALLPVGQALRLRGFRVIYDVHEHVVSSIAYKPYLWAPVRWALAAGYWVAERFLTSGMAVITTVESNVVRYRQPRRVVHNYAKLSDTQGVERVWREGPRRLLYLGRVCEAVGATMMIRVAAELDRRGVDIELRIVGSIGEPGLDGKMRDLVREHNLSRRVTIVGQVPFEEAMWEVAQADIGLCLFPPTPNNMLNLPRKMMEYLSFGLAVVASDFEGWREYLTDTGAGLQIPFGNVERMADAIQALLEDPERIRRMGRRAREAVEDRFCWEKEEAKLLAFYERLIEGRRRVTQRGGCIRVARAAVSSRR